jgi:hypothetical protein
MKVFWEDRLIAGAWWICAIIAGPISIAGFFVGGWLMLAALAAWWMNMDVKNPFKRSTDSWPDARRSDAPLPPDADEHPEQH